MHNIAAMDDKAFEAHLATLPDDELVLLEWRMRWTAKARRKQIPPNDKPWSIYGLRAGRGYGKTEAGAEWIGLEAASDPGSLNFVIAPTFDDVKETCFDGPSGLNAVIPPGFIVKRDKGLPSITLWNGSFIRGFSADSHERLRGPQCHRGWLDEIAAWRNAQKVWDNYRFGLRLGKRPQTMWTSTLRPTPFVRSLLKMRNSIIVQGSTYENRENLAEDFFTSIAAYEGTAIGRQEIYGELLDASDNGFIKRAQWKMWPADKPLPRFNFIILSLDTAFTEKTFDKKEQTGDPTAGTVWGVFEHEGKINVLLLDCWEEWLGLPELIKKVKVERKKEYGQPAFMYSSDTKEPAFGKPMYGSVRGTGRVCDLVLIEDKGSGISLRQVLASEEIMSEPYNPGNADKLARLHTVSPMFAMGRVWAVESGQRPGEFRDWAEPALLQICTYVGEGSVDRDDVMDSSTQALKYVMDRFMGGGGLMKPPKTKQQLVEDMVKAIPSRGAVNAYG